MVELGNAKQKKENFKLQLLKLSKQDCPKEFEWGRAKS